MNILISSNDNYKVPTMVMLTSFFDCNPEKHTVYMLESALSDGTRLRIVELLASREYCVRALSLKLNLSESAVSQHMKILRDAGLAEGMKYGYYTHYRLCREPLATLGQSLYELAETPHVRQECDAAAQVGCKVARPS